MSQAVGGAGSRAGEKEPALTVLASRTDFAPRVRNLLEGVLALCSSGLERTVVATLNEVEMQLFKLAEQGRNNEQQHRCFETLREIKRGRADVAPRYMLAIEDALAHFDKREKADPAAAVKPRPGVPVKQELSLVDTSDLEESLALQEFAAKNEIRQAQTLYTLGHRFGVLAGAPTFDPESLPIGPAMLGRALRRAAACLDISADHRVLLYRTFDRMTLTAIGTFYEAVNTYLIDQRILRHLRAQAPRLKSGQESKTDGGKEEAEAAPAEQPTESQQQPGYAPAAHRGGVAHGGHAPPPQSPRPMHQGSPGVAGTAPPTSAFSRAAAAADWSGAQSHSAPADNRDSELFTTLRELLAGRRHALGMPEGAASSGYVPSGEDVQSVLSALQSKPVSPLMMGGKVVQRSVAHLKQDLLSQLRQLAPDGRAPQLAAEDSDTIDLVGMLFDYITKNVRPDGSTQSLMTKLQVPLLRVALRDKSFFTRRAHPARQLLNAIAETGSHWIDDSEGPADRALVDKMQVVVDRVTQDFDGNLGLMEEMLTGLSQHMHTLARKAEVTERRHVDAAKGREKLAAARERAGNAIGARISAARPGKLVRTILEQAWTDVLALTLLRQGENSEMYKKRLAVADRLLASDSGRDGVGNAAPIELRDEIETGLDQVGYHKDDIQAVVKRLFLPEQAANEESPSSNTEIAIKLKSKARLGDDGTDAQPATDAVRHKVTMKPNSEHSRMFERLKTLPFGTWFEFRTNQQGDKVRRKLAWFSTLTGRCLFVNQRGARTDEKMLEQLALDVVTGQASIVEPDQETLVDRAWKAIVTSLKQLVGRDPLPVPA
jgi:sRNA-binding protein